MDTERALWVLLAITLATQVSMVAALFVDRALPGIRIWPPPARRSWQSYYIWGGSWLHNSGAFLLAVFDWNSLGLDPRILIGVGLPLIALGQAILAWGFRTLSLHTTLGFGGPFIRQGPYQYSRNPQYVGACVYLAGLALVSGSALAVAACAGGMVWYVVAPFGEEPHLREQFGLEYDSYCREGPRFVGPHRRLPSP